MFGHSTFDLTSKICFDFQFPKIEAAANSLHALCQKTHGITFRLSDLKNQLLTLSK